MGKSIIEEAKSELKNKKKETNEMKHRGLKETLKTIAITILVTAIIAFVGGVQYEQLNTAKVHAEAKTLSSLATVEVKK